MFVSREVDRTRTYKEQVPLSYAYLSAFLGGGGLANALAAAAPNPPAIPAVNRNTNTYFQTSLGRLMSG